MRSKGIIIPMIEICQLNNFSTQINTKFCLKCSTYILFIVVIVENRNYGSCNFRID